EGDPGRPQRRTWTEPAMRRSAEDFRRVERGQIRAVRVMRPLKHRPRVTDQENRETEKHHQRLDPPRVSARGLSETPVQYERRRRHGIVLAPPGLRPGSRFNDRRSAAASLVRNETLYTTAFAAVVSR